MTIYDSLQIWLTSIINDIRQIMPSPFVVIDLENIPEFPNLQNSGLFSSPNDIHDPLMAGQVKHTEFKSFYLRRPFLNTDIREENEKFFDELRKRIYNRNLDWVMPNDGREWISIEINAGIYPAQRDDGDRFADYLVPLKLVYIS
jgi:hypothetical protein